MRASLIVAVGAALGASARWGIGEWLAHSPGEFPWSTLLVNIVGCLGAGLALRTVVRGSERWLALVTGLLGGLTTFSAFSVETRGLLDAGRVGIALVYVGVSVIGGIVAVEVARGDGGP